MNGSRKTGWDNAPDNRMAARVLELRDALRRVVGATDGAEPGQLRKVALDALVKDDR